MIMIGTIQRLALFDRTRFSLKKGQGIVVGEGAAFDRVEISGIKGSRREFETWCHVIGWSP